MSIPSNTRRPHIAASARIARDSGDDGGVDYEAVIRELIAKVPEAERARYCELLLGDQDALDGRTSPPAQDSVDARIERAAALARAGDMAAFNRLVYGLPNLNRIEAPAPSARRRPATAQDAYAAALTSGARREATAEVSKLFPNMNRI